MNHRNKINITIKKRRMTLVVILLFVSFSLMSENLQKVVNLEGTWKFTVGDDPQWAKPEFNDYNWENVYAPRTWESNGFEEYNGFAWYRKTFRFNSSSLDVSLFLVLGIIDDVDEVYFNGHLIGSSGQFPPTVITTYDLKRKYHIPKELINLNGDNTIAVRVYDEYADGGIYQGPLGIFYDEDNELLSYNLSGYWDFETKTKQNNISRIYGVEVGKIFVPGYWELYGYNDIKGSAVYSKSFMLPSDFNSEDLMLVLGYVDDMEIVYFNDELIGKTDDLKNAGNRNIHESDLLSAYEIPSNVLIKGGSNEIVIKVFDTGGYGGIYEGPVGLITKRNFQSLKKRQAPKSNSIWDEIYNSIFD
ncbi:MAG: glycoside hydrolase [Marinilabiliales bacterium]|nr:MAG: glycoside hydrolase [Marinilabiliales bacterium]